MARGANSKTIATDIILKAFPGSFTYDKEIRIPFVEDGENIQLKCVLTCAKTNAIPGEVSNKINFEEHEKSEEQVKHTEISEEEKENLRNLMNVLGL